MTSIDYRIDAGLRRAGGDWQAELAGAVRNVAELCRLLRLPGAPITEPGEWPVLVPRPYLARIRPGDPQDPLLLQVLPRPEESESPSGFSTDPLCEATGWPAPGVLWKYRGRALIVATGRCGVHCRFCFRRHFPFPSAPPDLAAFGATGVSPVPPTKQHGQDARGTHDLACSDALDRIARETSLHEVILSGGDPLVLRDDQLAYLIDRLVRIAHLRRLRIHTRMPIVIPSRVTRELVERLRRARLTPIVVVHVNHPAEIDRPVADALGRLIDAGIPVLSQSVLLGEVNDQPDVLAELFERLVDLRVIPYYLHQLDRVAGAAHFEVPEARGRALVESLRARLPGYAVPRYVREVPGAPGKVPLD